MPKPTFLNLPEEKRELIISIALEEFAFNSFNTASLSKIVEKAHIAKGSMYQYFDNKEALYAFLVDYASEKKLAYVRSALSEQPGDFFQMYKAIIATAARFDLTHPLYSSFLYTVGKDFQNPEHARQIMAASTAFIKALLEDANRKGQIRQGVDLDLAAFIISYVSVDVGDYLAAKYNYSYLSILRAKSGKLPMSEGELDAVLDQLVEFYKRGIAAE